MAENDRQFQLPKLEKLPYSIPDPSWEYDKEYLECSMNSLIILDSMVDWIDSSTAQPSVYMGVEVLLNSLVSFGICIKNRRILFSKYKIDNRLPQELQDILIKMDSTFNYIQAHYLEVISYLHPSTLSNLTIPTEDVDKGNINLTNEKMSSTIDKSMKNLDLHHKKVEKLSTITNNGQKQLLNKFYNTEEVEKCKNLLLEMKKMDCVPLQKHSVFNTKYFETIDDIIKHADLLATHKVFLPKLFLLLAYSQENYRDINKEKDDGLYNDCIEDALKLEGSIITSIIKIQEVIKELDMTFNENDY